jgi:hypothetical protein
MVTMVTMFLAFLGKYFPVSTVASMRQIAEMAFFRRLQFAPVLHPILHF